MPSYGFYRGRRVPLDKPMRASELKNKQNKVYVKDGDSVKKVGFGDPNMRNNRDRPQRRKSFRARHKCDLDKPTDKTKPRYWACKTW